MTIGSNRQSPIYNFDSISKLASSEVATISGKSETEQEKQAL